jgi:hypothetical protein
MGGFGSGRTLAVAYVWTEYADGGYVVVQARRNPSAREEGRFAALRKHDYCTRCYEEDQIEGAVKRRVDHLLRATTLPVRMERR